MPSMTTSRPGQVVLIAFTFLGGAEPKRRPALVVLASGVADPVLATITTRQYRTDHDVAIVGWHEAGLAAPSVVRLPKLATIERGLVDRRRGTLAVSDRQRVALVMRRAFGDR